jgi:hypothetical protein
MLRSNAMSAQEINERALRAFCERIAGLILGLQK